MKKKFLCSTLAMAMTASMLFGCASESKTETTAAAGETTAAAAETTAEAAKAETNGEKLKVTLLVPVPSAIRHSTTPHRPVWKSLRPSLVTRLK